MPQLPVALRKARAARLRAAGERALSRFLDGQIGRTTAVLIEKQEADGRLLGRSETFPPVRLPQGEVAPGVPAAYTGRGGDPPLGLPRSQLHYPAACATVTNRTPTEHQSCM